MTEIARPLAETTEQRGGRVSRMLKWLFDPQAEGTATTPEDKILLQNGWEITTPEVAAEVTSILRQTSEY